MRDVRANSRRYGELLAADTLPDHFESAVARVRGLGAGIIEEPHVNPAPQHKETWLRDPDGYVVVICSPDGDCGS